jgi:hypothetical protein
MQVKNLEEIFKSLKEKMSDVTNLLNDLESFNKNNLEMNIDNIKLLDNLTTNINFAKDTLVDIKMEVLNIQDSDELSLVEKENLRNYRFQKIFNKKFLPLILYLRISMES